MKEAITNFLSNRTNLTIFQCLLYFIVGYIMGEHLSYIELAIMFIVMFGIQFITRIKAVTDGMMFRQLMIDNKMETNEFLKHMKREADKLNNIDKEDLN
tara:strand:- start:176 stop:472 length:297 start_codon:yes stop_codon:yes gene_type:complete